MGVPPTYAGFDTVIMFLKSFYLFIYLFNFIKSQNICGNPPNVFTVKFYY